MFDYAKHLSEEDTDPEQHMQSTLFLRRKSVQGIFSLLKFIHKTCLMDTSMKVNQQNLVHELF